MTGIVALVRSRVEPGCVEKGSLRDDGCSVTMQGLPRERVAINLEQVAELDFPKGLVRRDSKHCDFLVVAEEDASKTWAVALELKGSSFRATDVRQQLEGGAAALDKLIPSERPLEFRPILASRRIPKAQRDSFRRERVRFRGVGHRLLHLRCQGALLSRLRS